MHSIENDNNREHFIESKLSQQNCIILGTEDRYDTPRPENET